MRKTQPWKQLPDSYVIPIAGEPGKPHSRFIEYFSFDEAGRTVVMIQIIAVGSQGGIATDTVELSKENFEKIARDMLG